MVGIHCELLTLKVCDEPESSAGAGQSCLFQAESSSSVIVHRPCVFIAQPLQGKSVGWLYVVCCMLWFQDHP